MKNKLNAWDVLYIKWLLNLLYWFSKNDFILNWALFLLAVSEQAVSEKKWLQQLLVGCQLLGKLLDLKIFFFISICSLPSHFYLK